MKMMTGEENDDEDKKNEKMNKRLGISLRLIKIIFNGRDEKQRVNCN